MAPKDQAPPIGPDETQAADGCPYGVRAPTYGEIALKLLDNGYEPLPLRPGRNRPVLERWSSLRIDEATVRAWAAKYPHCGVGLRTCSLVGVDIDVMDPAWRTPPPRSSGPAWAPSCCGSAGGRNAC